MARLQDTRPKRLKRARASIREHVAAMVELSRQGVPTFDYGNNIRQVALEEGLSDAFAFPGFVPAYIRPLFCKGIGPFRWAALSGDPDDILRTDAKVKELVPDNASLHKWLDMAQQRIVFQGLPARICWVGSAAPSAAFQRDGAAAVKAPIVIGRDHSIWLQRRRAKLKRCATVPMPYPTGPFLTLC